MLMQQLMQQGLAPGLVEQLAQSLRHQAAPSQQAQAAPGVSTWPEPCRLRGATPRLIHSLLVTEATQTVSGAGQNNLQVW